MHQNLEKTVLALLGVFNLTDVASDWTYDSAPSKVAYDIKLLAKKLAKTRLAFLEASTRLAHTDALFSAIWEYRCELLKERRHLIKCARLDNPGTLDADALDTFMKQLREHDRALIREHADDAEESLDLEVGPPDSSVPDPPGMT